MKTWITANLNFGSSEYFSDEFSFRYKKYDIDDFILYNINKNVSPEDTLIVVGNVLSSSSASNYLGSILCKNLFCVPSKKDLELIQYITPFFEVIEGPIFTDNYIMLYYDYEDCKDYTLKYGLGACGSPFYDWKINDNIFNVSIDLWDFSPVNVETLEKRKIYAE